MYKYKIIIIFGWKAFKYVYGRLGYGTSVLVAARHGSANAAAPPAAPAASPSPNCALWTQRPALFSYTKDCELLDTKWNILLVGNDIMR